MAKRITKSAVNSTLKQGIATSIKKAFGADHAIHIKESGPTWVNSPHRDLGDAVINPVISKKIIVSVNRRK